ncbi:MAG: single-stranded-DNA-specific exonuclease RecJ [Clostridiales Family XIII bacterium]|jgi:single-stranded-DNA-specific exonuclease|nr:single-stranded-DNA-specific exonuclease RecJ [Clostridiales Family XIII bacterium]
MTRSAETLFAEILEKRGVTEAKQAEYLSPSPKLTYDPLLLPDMAEGVDFVLTQIEKNRRICIYGDYDVDGVMGSVILKTFFDSLGADTGIYIPARVEEGYGLNYSALDQISGEGYGAVVTVDCGSVSVSEVSHAKSIGLEIMITDHHDLPDVIKPDCIVINPKISGSKYPFRELCGAAVAFKLCQALSNAVAAKEFVLGRPPRQATPATPPQEGNSALKGVLNSLLDLVAVATVADVMPLVDENRTMVKWGLRNINAGRRRSLVKLAHAAGLHLGEITARGIAFGISPRINSVGRLSAASKATELFLTDDDAKVDEIIEEMQRLNDERKSIQNACEEECLTLAEAYRGSPSFLLLKPSVYHEGISGIVAGRIKEKTGLPTAVLAPSEPIDGAPTLKGSARSVGNLNIIELFRRHEELFARLGGHKMAAGFTILRPNEDELRASLNEDLQNLIKETPNLLSTEVEADISAIPEEITLELAKLIEKMEPFGSGNPKPLVEIDCTAARITDVKTMGKENNHLRFNVSPLLGSANVPCVYFNNTELPKSPKSIVATPNVNAWNGRESVQLMVDTIIT